LYHSICILFQYKSNTGALLPSSRVFVIILMDRGHVSMRPSIEEKELFSRLADILANLPVIAAYLYGSYLDHSFNKKSDIDIALLFKDSIDGHDATKIELNISAQLDQHFAVPFDVRSINDAPLKVKGEILTQGKLVFCADEELRVDFETFVRSRYFDFLPSLRAMRKTYFSAVKSGGIIG
jgi:predicted nucleotidyltransferase